MGNVGHERAREAFPVADRTRVLVVDDDATNRLLATLMLEKLDCTVEAVASGAEALQRITSRDYDVTVMDGSMPEMDGFQATALVREHEREREHRTWIIALTAHALTEDRERFLAAGFDDYVVKPYDLASLRRALQRALEHIPG